MRMWLRHIISIHQRRRLRLFVRYGAASRKIENLTRRIFLPYKQQKYFPWPPYWTTSSFRLWLEDDLLDATEVLLRAQDSNPTILPSSSYFLEPVNSQLYSPYRCIEIDIRQGYYFGGGLTWQRTVAITGTWGYRNQTVTGGTLSAAISSTSATKIYVGDSSLIGIGNTILVDSEQMFVTDKQNYDLNAVLMADLDSDKTDNVIQLSTTAINQGEVFIIGSENMYVQDISGNNYTVIRAYQSDLSSHSESDAVYVPRSLTVQRGVGGTTAATHTNGTAINVYTVPDDVEELCIAETIVALMESEGGYYRWVGSDRSQREYSGRGIEALRTEVQQRYSVRRVGAI